MANMGSTVTLWRLLDFLRWFKVLRMASQIFLLALASVVHVIGGELGAQQNVLDGHEAISAWGLLTAKCISLYCSA